MTNHARLLTYIADMGMFGYWDDGMINFNIYRDTLDGRKFVCSLSYHDMVRADWSELKSLIDMSLTFS